jgi:hypothetical protein
MRLSGLELGQGPSGHLAWCLIVDETLAQSEAECAKMNPGMNAMKNEIKIRDGRLKGC